MSIKDKVIIPNYERMRESFVYTLQTAWDDYCKAHSLYLKSMWFNGRGELCTSYTKEAKQTLDEAEAAFIKAGKDLQDFDAWVRMGKGLKE